MLMMTGSTERARRMGIHEAVISLGMVAGSTAGGLVYQELSMAAALSGGAGLIALAACVQTVMVVALRRRAPTPSEQPRSS